jgi:integrase
MKMRLPHEVPLSRQALALLDVLRPLTGHGRYVFSFNDKPMSDGTVNKALRSMGYDTKTEHCAHGFRAMASTLMNAERNKDGSPVWEPDAIELCLAHVDDSTPRGIYNRAKLMPERIRIMQHYADTLDTLRHGGTQVVPLKRTRARAEGRA